MIQNRQVPAHLLSIELLHRKGIYGSLIHVIDIRNLFPLLNNISIQKSRNLRWQIAPV